MGLLDVFRKKSEPVSAQDPPRVHIPAVQQAGDPNHYQHSALRRRPTVHNPSHSPPIAGMWVVYGNRTGILTNLHAGDVYDVALVDDQGLTTQFIRAQGQELRQAWYEEIPPSRRPTPDEGARMGYHGRPS